VTVTELLRLAPFSLGTITILLAAGGLLFGHAYGRYGDDAAMGFLMRARFALAAALVLPIPVLMLVSFGAGRVPSWLTEAGAAALVGLGLATTAVVVGYLLISVGRPRTFLASVGRRVRVRRLNRYARSRHWRDSEEFSGDLATGLYQWSRRGRNFGSAGRLAFTGCMHARRLGLRAYRTDPSEMLFDAAAAGLGNGSMRTWRAALEVVGRRLQSPSLEPLAAKVMVTNALVLEEAAHRQGSEDCKVRLACALGVAGQAPLADESADELAKGISKLAERRLGENRPVLAVIDALNTLAVSNPLATVRVMGWLGQHLLAVAPPPPAYGFDGYRAEHPTRVLFASLSELAERANRESDGRLNDALIDASAMIARAAPGKQDCETLDALAAALARAGENAARRYGADEGWHGTFDAVRSLHHLYGVVRSHCAKRESRDVTAHAWFVETMAVIGSFALGNRESIHVLDGWGKRSDMGVHIAKHLADVPVDTLVHALHELWSRQHNEKVPREQREEFIGICQRIRDDLLGFRNLLEVPEGDAAEDQAR
jgi:hypothetical protein